MTKHKHRGADVPAFGRQPDAQTVMTKPKPVPRDSWWCCPPDEFYARLRQQHARMEASTFGTAKKLITDHTGVARS